MVMNMIEIELLSQDPIDVSIQKQNTLDVNIAESVIKEGSYVAGDWITIVNNRISVIPQTTDEFVISDEKVLGIDHVDVSKIDGIEALIDEAMLRFGIATDLVPGMVLSSADEDSIVVLASGKMSINSVNINKIYQDADTEVVMYGGDSDI